jgi:hypothetical protein
MSDNNLRKPIPYRPTPQQEKAFERLEKAGYNRSAVIRIAIDQYLDENSMPLLKVVNTNKNIPEFAT